jgi:hypothetical protein
MSKLTVYVSQCFYWDERSDDPIVLHESFDDAAAFSQTQADEVLSWELQKDGMWKARNWKHNRIFFIYRWRVGEELTV